MDGWGNKIKRMTQVGSDDPPNCATPCCFSSLSARSVSAPPLALPRAFPHEKVTFEVCESDVAVASMPRGPFVPCDPRYGATVPVIGAVH